MDSRLLPALLAATFAAAPLLGAVTASAQPLPASAPPAADDAAKRDEARAHFDKGLGLFEEQAWAAAVAEFLRSREIFATRAATTDAAVCLRKLHRFDEALDMFEALLKEFPQMAANDRASAERERAELAGLVGAIEIRSSEADASMVVDGQERGAARSGQRVRVSAGSHVVRVYKEGFNPFELHVEVSGGQTAVVDAKLGALTKSGRLRVSEQNGLSVDVIVDGVIVGKTPWDGQLALGDHTVQLRGEGDVGTQPVSAPVEQNHTNVLTLQAEELSAGLRVSPTPVGATVAIDGVVVGRGLWTGKLRTGQHRVEVAAEGFLPITRPLNLAKGQQESLAAELDRDPNSALWRALNPSRFTVEVDGAFAVAPSLGGDIASSCDGACTKGPGLGGLIWGRAGYQLGSGLGFSLDAGYFAMTQAIHDRATVIQPTGVDDRQGVASDTLSLSGLLLGAEAAFHRGAKIPVTFGLGFGALIGTLDDHRTGDFETRAMTSYHADVVGSATARYLYLDPKARVGFKLGAHFELNVGVDVMILVALTQPHWDAQIPIPAGSDGAAYFHNDALVGKTALVLGPGLGARYEL